MTRHKRYGSYVVIDWDVDGEDAEPLSWCLRFAISDEFPFDYFLRGILTGDPNSPGGGDPGWVMYPERLPDGTTVYHAWTNADMSYLDPCEGVYDEAIVKRLVRRTLENYRKAHPKLSDAISAAVAIYGL